MMWLKCPMCRFKLEDGCCRFEDDGIYLNRYWLWHMKDTHGIYEDDLKFLIDNAIWKTNSQKNAQ